MNYKEKKMRSGKIFTTALILTMVFFVTACGKTQMPSDTKLFLVGMGPGDADLITIRALDVISGADVIVCFEKSQKRYEPVISKKKVITAPHGFWHNYGRKIEHISDPKEAQNEKEIAPKRDEFIKEIRSLTSSGKTVAVLDSGDPLVYGPWAWILEEFEDLNPYVVPGLSSFNAANAAMKKPPTNSASTKSVILSANDWKGKKDTIDKLSKMGATMALFTMRAEFDYFIDKLKAGYPLDTPVAVVMHAGYKDKEKVITGTLGDIKSRIKEPPFEYMIYIGDFITYKYKGRK
jgi:precorrin-4 methylase